jgi:thioesterase domain-containing protein
MAPVESMPPESRFGVDYLQARITNEFPLARHMGIVVERADEGGIALSAPLAANANYKGTAFGGSLFSVAVLAGWAWVTRYLATTPFIADTVIQESSIRYVAPVHGTLRASLQPPPPERIEKFRRMLQRAGRGRILLDVNIHHGHTLTTEFEGTFAATLRDLET